jgi:hypothetical protein
MEAVATGLSVPGFETTGSSHFDVAKLSMITGFL